MHRTGYKHIFYVHSHITYIVTLSTIKFLNLDTEYTLLICGRNYNVPDPIANCIQLTSSEYQLQEIPTYGENFLVIHHYHKLRAIDQIIDKFVKNTSFIAYLPSTRNFLMQFIATHPKCIGVNIIEEGLMTFTGQFFKPHQPYYTKSLRGQITKYVKYLNHLNRSRYYEARPYAERPILFAISTELQNRITEMEVIVLPRIITPDLPKEFTLYGNTIFVMDLLVEREITSSKILLSILDLLIQAPLIRERSIMIKFHPEQNIQNQIIRLFQEREIDYQIIPNHVAVEAILLNYHHLNIYGFHSSLLFYASLWGHNVYSLLEILKIIDPLTTKRYQNKNIPPDIFSQKVNMLDYQSLATKQ